MAQLWNAGAAKIQVHCSLIITLCLRSIKEWTMLVVDLVIKGQFYKMSYFKMTMKCSFSNNSFVKFHDKRIWEPQHDRVISKLVFIMRCVTKGLHCISIFGKKYNCLIKPIGIYTNIWRSYFLNCSFKFLNQSDFIILNILCFASID